MTNIIVKETIEAWQPHYKMPLTEQDGKEIQNNIVDFSDLLQNWSRRQQTKERAS